MLYVDDYNGSILGSFRFLSGQESELGRERGREREEKINGPIKSVTEKNVATCGFWSSLSAHYHVQPSFLCRSGLAWRLAVVLLSEPAIIAATAEAEAEAEALNLH